MKKREHKMWVSNDNFYLVIQANGDAWKTPKLNLLIKSEISQLKRWKFTFIVKEGRIIYPMQNNIVWN